MLRKLTFVCMLFFAVSVFAQRSLIITHDDPVLIQQQPGGGATVTPQPDTLSSYAVQPDGSLLLVGSFPTGLNGGASAGDANGGGVGFIPLRKIAVSGDNKFVFATGAPTNVISSFSIDGATGILTQVPGSPFPTGTEACNGMGLAASPNGKNLYAASACGAAGPVPGGNPVVSAFAISPGGALSKIGTDQPIQQPLDMAVTGDGKFLVISNGGIGGQPPVTTVFNIAADGSLTLQGTPFQVLTSGFSSATQVDCANHVFHGIDDLTSKVEVFNLGSAGLTQIAGSPFIAIPQAQTSGGLVGSALVEGGKFLVVSDEFGFAVSFSIAPDGSLAQVGGQVPGTAQIEMGQMTADSSGGFVYSRGVTGIAAFSVDANGNLANVPGSPLPSGNLTPFGTMAAYPVHQCAAAPAVVKFGAFNVELDEKTTAPRSFELEGSFTLGAASNGIAPLSEAVTVTAGGYTATIPAGSFKLSSTGSFTFNGTIGGVKVEMSITPSATTPNKYSFEFEAPVDLSAAGSPVPVSVSIGDDTGSATVKPQLKTS
jgi:hypothetical protein